MRLFTLVSMASVSNGRRDIRITFFYHKILIGPMNQQKEEGRNDRPSKQRKKEKELCIIEYTSLNPQEDKRRRRAITN